MRSADPWTDADPVDDCFHCKPTMRCAAHRGTFEPFPGTDAHTFIQWKGTDVCIDIYCPCGGGGHVDDDFMYWFQCDSCGTVYECGTQIKMRKVTDPAELADAEASGCIKHDYEWQPSIEVTE